MTRYPFYIPSKGRHDNYKTMGHLDKMNIDYYVIVEPNEADLYAKTIPKSKILVLPDEYNHNYQSLDNLGLTKSLGPGPKRNYAWDHSIKLGAEAHWVIDDNIAGFYVFRDNLRLKCVSSTFFRVQEQFMERYENMGMLGPSYSGFVPDRSPRHHYIAFNTRVYSCNLIKNDINLRWRGRYNEDTILSVDMLERGYCTAQFKVLLQAKIKTQVMEGGNNKDFYQHEGTKHKSDMLKRVYPQYVNRVIKYGREHHNISYRKYWQKHPRLIPKKPPPKQEKLDFTLKYLK